MAGYRIISSDDHVYEPADLWTTRVEPKFRDRAPRVVRTEDGSDWWYCDGMKGISAATGSQVGMRFEEPEKLGFDFKLEDVRRGGYIPEERIKDLDADGIDVCINYPTSGLVLYSLPDSELLTSLFKAYNDWLAEFCKPFPGRIKGVAMLNADDVPSAVQELGRCAKMGLIGATISMYPSEERSYQSPEYEPLWAAAQDLRMPLSLHIGTNRPGPGQQFADLAKMPPGWFANVDHWVRVSISHMIFSGVFERYPKLQVGSIEMETGWIPHLMNTIDYIYTQKSTRFAPHRFKEDMLPSDYYRRNVFASFQEDALGIRLRDVIGVDNLLWGSDYPHPEATFPRSREILGEILVDCTEEEKAKIVCRNAERIYGI